MIGADPHCRRFTDKVVLVAGASSGIGEAAARRLFAEGASVALLARRQDRLAAILAELDSPADRALAVPADVTDFEAIKRAVEVVIERFGRLDVLVNSAGQEVSYPLPSMKADHIHGLFAANLEGTINCCKAVYSKLPRGGAVVNIASVMGLKGGAAVSVYAMTKGGIIAFTKSLAAEVARRGVRVNSVSPGMVKTELLERSFHKLSEAQIAVIEAQHLLGFGRPGDVAAAVAFLASDDAAWITGTNLIVDGGYTC